MRALGLAVLLVSFCAAHAQEAAAPPTTGTIGGIVRDGRTGDPMPDVRVQLSGKSTRGTPADPDGRFLFEDLDAGVYTLQVSPPKGAAQIARRTVTLAAGQTVDLDILAESSARLSGRVVDQDGKPVAGMVLFLMRQNLLGTLPYLQSGSATSNESGAFTLEGVPTGMMLLLMADRPTGSWLDPISKDPADPAKRKPIPEAGWYPDAVSAATAAPLMFYPGEERQNIEIRVKTQPGRCVEGVVEDAHGPAELDCWFPSGRSATGEDGHFRFCGVPRAEFTITASRSGEEPVYGTATIPAGEADVAGIKIVAKPPLTLHGRVELQDPPASGKLDGTVAIQLMSSTPMGSGGTVIRGHYEATSSVPGAFTIPNVFPGDYTVTAGRTISGATSKIPAEYVPISLLSGGAPKTFHFPGGGDLVIVMGRWTGGTLLASAANSDGKPAPDAWIVVYPRDVASEAALAGAGRYCSHARGECKLALPAGVYLALATAGDIELTRESLARVWRARSKAAEIEITPGSTIQVTLLVTKLE